MCFNLDYYIFDNDDQFVNENREFKKINVCIIYNFLYLFIIIYLCL